MIPPAAPALRDLERRNLPANAASGAHPHDESKAPPRKLAEEPQPPPTPGIVSAATQEQVPWSNAFLEVGGFTGIEFSNSYFFEKALNWRGLLIEAFPANCKQLRTNRGSFPPDTPVSERNGIECKALCSEAEYFRRNGTVSFASGAEVPSGGDAALPGVSGTGGLVSAMSEEHKKQWIKGEVQVPCRPISWILGEHLARFGGALPVFFLDVEGGELDVLQSLEPFLKKHDPLLSIASSTPRTIGAPSPASKKAPERSAALSSGEAPGRRALSDDLQQEPKMELIVTQQAQQTGTVQKSGTRSSNYSTSAYHGTLLSTFSRRWGPFFSTRRNKRRQTTLAQPGDNITAEKAQATLSVCLFVIEFSDLRSVSPTRLEQERQMRATLRRWGYRRPQRWKPDLECMRFGLKEFCSIKNEFWEHPRLAECFRTNLAGGGGARQNISEAHARFIEGPHRIQESWSLSHASA
ncbi:unnamed protein product [Amoebophrya sp. A120]|nr:unnamed protein product [Amoebophrya sp. A120]|eukprot:GSA120T00023067001.1